MPLPYIIKDLKGEAIIETFYEKKPQNKKKQKKKNEEEFGIVRVLKRKGDNLYLKREGFDNSFNR